MTQADTQRDPFIECYRAWLKQKAFSVGTGADFLASFSNTSGNQLNSGLLKSKFAHVPTMTL